MSPLSGIISASRVRGGGVWSPLALSPAVWLSDTGADVAEWPDLSGNSRHATQASGTLQPAIATGEINGKQVRSFDGTADYMSLPYSYTGTSLSVFWVEKRPNFGDASTSGAAFATPSTYDFADNGNFITAYMAGLFMTYRNGGKATATAPASNTPFIAATIFDGANNTFYLNGAASSPVASSGAFSFTHVYFGRRWYQEIYGQEKLAEFIVVPYALDSTERAALFGYLGTKYNITVS